MRAIVSNTERRARQATSRLLHSGIDIRLPWSRWEVGAWERVAQNLPSPKTGDGFFLLPCGPHGPRLRPSNKPDLT